MSLPFLTSSKTVLMISDEALFIYKSGGRGAKLIEVVPWSAENFEEDVSAIISKECGGKPVLILNDMVEQHYRKEKIPRVGVMDKQNVIRRKLKVSFPNYPVRAALPLKAGGGKGDKGAAGSSYIFAAVPASDAFLKTMAAIRESLVPIAGFCLLPVEASDMIKRLSDKLVSREVGKAQWTVFIGQHQSGGLRQIVTRNGEIALTRMTPIVDNDNDPVLWGKEVYQEFQATMSYLSRFGFDSSDGLNVILISEPATGDIVNEMMDVPCNFYSLTTEDAASLLKIPLGFQEVSHHADALHVAWIGRKSQFILPMKAKQIDIVSKPRQVAALFLVFLMLIAAFQGYLFMNYLQKVSESNADVGAMIQRKEQLDLRYSKEIKRKEDMGYNIQLIQSSLSLYDEFEGKRIRPLPLFYSVGTALGRDMRIDRIEIVRGSAGFAQKIVNRDAKSPLFVAAMQMSFPSTSNVTKGNSELRNLQARLQKMMPDHVVKVTKFLEDYEYSEEIVVETGDAARPVSEQDYVAEISIEGALE